MDRLSNLPDSVICHILSFLPTKFSAATSILSKRWRYLWTDVPVLDLHYSSFVGYRFPDIVYAVLMRHNHGDLHTFRLTTTKEYHQKYWFTRFQFETWISNVAARGLRNLHLRLSSAYCIPQCLFVCKTLVQLSLQECRIESSIVRLPSLKKLHLVDVHFSIEESFSDLISGCPVLEELVIDWTTDFFSRKQFGYRVSSPTIKFVKIVRCKDSHHYQYTMDRYPPPLEYQYTMDMDTPALEYLKIEGYLPKYLSGQTQTSLIEADISVTISEDEKQGETFSTVLNFVDKLHNVGSLCLRLSVDHFTEVDDAAFATSTAWFHNLKKLELAADRRFLLKFLEYAPNLRVIIMQKVDKYLNYWEESPQVHPCLTSHLTSIIIHEFEGTAQDLEMITYLLRNAKTLETMDIYFKADSFDDNQKRDEQKSISLFERGSPACKLRFG